MHFVIVGLSHKTAPISVREKLALPGEEISRTLTGILQDEDIQEGMLVSTCNRVEAYLVAKHTQRASFAIQKMFSEAAGIAEEDLEKFLYVKESGEAIAHLFRVTSSLDSMVVGETQISGQIKEAYTRAVACQGTGAYLNRLIHTALHVAKRIRTETGIGRLPVSVSFAAVLLAEKIFGELRERKIILLGAGEMGLLAARHLKERDAGEIWIASRTTPRAQEAAAELGAVPLPLESLAGKLSEADILIASTAAPDYLIRETEVREAMKKRRNRPMFFIDIAVPRNIDPAVNRIENVYLYDIDHLNGIVEGNLKEREREAKRAEGIIAGEVEKFLDGWNQREISPTIRQLSKKFDRIREQEVGKYLTRHPGLDAGQREALEGLTRAIVNKILHEPIVRMKTEQGTDGAPGYSEILKKLFKLEG